MRDRRAISTQLYLRSRIGHSIRVQFQSVLLRDEEGTNLGAVKILQPISASAIGNRRQDRLSPYGCMDTLTGVLNHSMIQARVKGGLNLYAFYPVPFTVMCFAIDELPKLRERYGQAAVDAALRIVAQAIKIGLRPTDFLGRLLHEEFLAMLTECSEANAIKVGQRLGKLVQHSTVSWWGDSFHVTASGGATAVHDPEYVEQPTAPPLPSSSEPVAEETHGTSHQNNQEKH